ncbi:MAG: glycosyltransferase [Paracoccaceae bacterium]
MFCNEIIAANLATRPIADHPLIGRHVAQRCFRRPVVIPYGGDVVSTAPRAPVRALGVKPGQYFLSVARIEPENSILQIIEAFDQAATGMDLLVLGNMDPDRAYHRKVRRMAGRRVRFVGGIYDDARLKAIRFHARAYFHGHQVGGTNPSLVEALGAGNAVIAHDNAFNRWTAGAAQMFFTTAEDCAAHARRLARDDLALQAAKAAARARHARDFRWPDVLARYQSLLLGDAAGLQIAAE